MLFNPLFLQNESGSENLFIAKPGTLKKKGYLFADIMRVYFNDSGKKNTLSSKLNLTSAEKNAGNTGLSEQNGASTVSLLTSNKIFLYKNNGTADAVQTNDLIANTPTVKVSLDKLKSILSKLLGNNGQVQTGDTEKLIKQLLGKLNKDGEIVLSVAQNGEKVAVDVSKVELTGSNTPKQINKKLDASGKSKTGNQNYAIKIVAIPPNFDLLNLTQKINNAASGEINILEVSKINVHASGKKGNRIITVFSIAAKSDNSTGKEVKNANSNEINKLVNSKVQDGGTADVVKAAIIGQSSGSKVISGSSFSTNPKEGMKNNASKNVLPKVPAANSTNSTSGKAVTISALNDSAEINGDSLNQKSVITPVSKTVVQTAEIKDIPKSKIITNTSEKKTIVKNIGSTEVITDGKIKIPVQKKSKININTKAQSGIEKPVSVEKGTTTEQVKTAATKTEKVTGETAQQKAPDSKLADVNKEAVKSTKVQSSVEKSVLVEKGMTTEQVKTAATKTEKVTVKAAQQKAPDLKTADVIKEAVRNKGQQINQNKKSEIHIPTAKETPVPKNSLSSLNETYINNPVILENQTVENTNVISSQAKKGIKIKQTGKDKKGTNDSGSSTESSNKLKTENNTVQQKESKQQNQNFENQANTKDNLTKGKETDGKDKSVKFNIQNTQNSNFNKSSIREISTIFGRPEKTIKLSEMVKEFSQFIKKKGKTKLVLQLDPAKLGKVKITLDVIKDVLKAHIEVETNAAKQTVQNNLQELYSQLNKSGINLGSVNITLYDGGSKETKQFSNKRKNGHSLNTKEDFADEEENTTTRKLGYNTYEFLA